MPTLDLFATCPRGVEPLLVAELAGFGFEALKEHPGGVAGKGDLACAYRACLWSRLASRILMPLARFPAADADALYAGAKTIDWPALFEVSRRFAIEVAGRSHHINHTHFASLKVKDAIVDAFREASGERPDVDTERPEIRIHLHLDGDDAGLSLDLAGDSLHRRHYRKDGVEAPLRENLAAAILVRAGWPELARAGAPLLDPMCGSGTLLIEGALIAADIAPGLARRTWGFEAWRGHDAALWQQVHDEAVARRQVGIQKLPSLIGQDIDEQALRAARANAERAGLASAFTWKICDVSDARPAKHMDVRVPPAQDAQERPGEQPGLVVTNPPYGERLGSEAEVIKLYSLLGATLKAHFGGWRASVFTARPDLGPRIGLRATRMYSLYNGALACKLLNFEIAPAPVAAAGAPARAVPGEEFANRLRKNHKHLAKWARRTGVTCYRVYDADLHEYALAVDLYQAEQLHVHVQEYAAPKTVDPVQAEKHLREALAQITQVLEVPSARLHFRVRKAQKGAAQYEKQDDSERFHRVEEHGCKLWVNFDDYLDTGLFLDHRPLRQRLQQEAQGKRLLNLFCYTASASAHAALGGAAQTVSVDLSNTYLDWARRNLRENGIEVQESGTFRERQDQRAPRGATRDPWAARRGAPASAPHLLVRADCTVWLGEQAELPRPPQFDLIFCDPPTFSNSKKMDGVFDVTRDHPGLILQCARLLAPGGVIYFSTNRRGFKLDDAALTGLAARDITAQTLDEDFRRPPPPHRCWAIRRA